MIDPAGITACDRYEVPARMRELVQLRHPVEAFPGSHRAATRCDLDHVIPWTGPGSVRACEPEPPPPTSRAEDTPTRRGADTPTGPMPRPAGGRDPDPPPGHGEHIWVHNHIMANEAFGGRLICGGGGGS